MKIIKYIKKGNGNYQIEFDNLKKINLTEEVILKNNLLYKKEIDEYTLLELINENNKYDIYNKCVKYISIRLRSTNEIKEFMIRKNIEPVFIDKTIETLTKNKLLDDEKFAKAFIKDKLNFTTMGPYRIELELKKHKIPDNIIYKYINEIDKEVLKEKINKQIIKLMKNKKNNQKNKIYTHLLSLGYSSEFILNNLNKYDF